MIFAAILAVTMVLDLEKSPIKDQRDFKCGTGVGYAGCLTECSLYEGVWNRWAFGPGMKETEKAMRGCGAYFIRQWSALDEWQMGMAGHGNYTHPKVYWSMWKRLGVKIMLTLEHYSVHTGKKCEKKSGKIEDVKKVVREYVTWIVKNKFTDVVAGFELGNEPYFGNDPETYAARCAAIVPVIKEVWPEARIGMPIAEYRAGDPDLAVVRKRLGEAKMMPGGGEFEINRFNQWSGRYVVAMSNVIDQISHVVYHFYGGDAAYGASASGFGRVRKFAEIYPQLAGKRLWITEARERSDEDVRCHKMWFSTLWKAHYMLLSLAQPECDGVNIHCLGCYAGGLNLSQFGRFYFQSDPLQGYNFYYDPDGGPGMRRYDLGPAAPMYRLYNEALMGHPVIMEHGTLGGQGPNCSQWSSAVYYESANRQRSALHEGKSWNELPPIKGNVEWIAALNGEKSELAILMVNTMADRYKLEVKLSPKSFGTGCRFKAAKCPVELAYHHNIPAEPPLWTEYEGKLTSAFQGNRGEIEIEPHAVQVVYIPVK